MTTRRYKAFADTLRILDAGPSDAVAKRFFKAASSQITQIRDERHSREAEREDYTRDDERYAELEEEDEAMILAQVADGLSVVGKFIQSPEAQQTIAGIVAELEMVQALTVYDHAEEQQK